MHKTLCQNLILIIYEMGFNYEIELKKHENRLFFEGKFKDN